jgi:putative membrane protein
VLTVIFSKIIGVDMNLLLDYFKGTIIGIANIIPGVSGGTMALVLGIYERLIDALHNISTESVIAPLRLIILKKGSFMQFKEEMKRIDAVFLLMLGIGALSSIIALAKLMTYLLKHQHDPTYGFFFGLVLLSVIAPFQLIRKKTVPVFLAIVIAMSSVFAVSFAVSGDAMLHKAQKKHELQVRTSQNIQPAQAVSPQNIKFLKFVYLFFLGAVSISAMILPGVSGSFLLLLLGGYFEILEAITTRNFPVLGAFALGCIVGILLFTRLLDYLLKKWYDTTMGFLVGLVIGSLWMIWPFKTSAVVGDETVYLTNMIPRQFSANEVLTVVAFIAGSLIVAAMLIIEYRGKKPSDDPSN